MQILIKLYISFMSTNITNQSLSKIPMTCKDCGYQGLPKREISTLIILLYLIIGGLTWKFSHYLLIGGLVFFVILMVNAFMSKPHCPKCKQENLEYNFEKILETKDDLKEADLISK